MRLQHFLWIFARFGIFLSDRKVLWKVLVSNEPLKAVVRRKMWKLAEMSMNEFTHDDFFEQ